jgi:hypothetical protein
MLIEPLDQPHGGDQRILFTSPAAAIPGDQPLSE